MTQWPDPQPIETAPRDEDISILVTDGYRWATARWLAPCRHGDGTWGDSQGNFYTPEEIRGWLPLPPIPDAKVKGAT